MEELKEYKEHLVHIKLATGDFIDFYKDIGNGRISLCSQDRCASLPDLTGLETTDLFSLLEPLGEAVEFPTEKETTEPTLEKQKDVGIEDNRLLQDRG